MIPPELALLSWPLFGIVLVYFFGPVTGATVSILSGILLLPESYAFDLPLLPPVSKYEIVALSAALGLALVDPRRVASAKLGRGPDLLILLFMASAFATSITNRDALSSGAAPLSVYDGLSMAIRDFLFVGLPFVVGRSAHRSPADLQRLLRVWFLAALIASVFALFEVRMTPLIHKFVYGFHASGLAQEFRWGGARPMLLMPNGLALSMFFSVAAICAAVLYRARGASERTLHVAGTLYLLVVLVLSRSLASIAYGASAATAVLFLRVRMQLLISLVLVSVAVGYPIARSLGSVTGETVVEFAEKISAERAQSFSFRLLNEDALIAFAAQRPLFGYGVFGNRNRFFNEATRRVVITDGYWVILLTGRGAVGLALSFGLLVIPVIRAWRRGPRVSLLADRAAVAGVALILSLQIADLLPNGLFTFLPFYVAGALWGGTSFFRTARQQVPPEGEAAVKIGDESRPRSLASLAGSRRRRGR